MLHTLLITLSLYLFSTEAHAPRQVQVGKNFTLMLNNQVQVHDSLSGSITTLMLTSLTDSRCPKDVLCVQAGEVVAQLQVASTGQSDLLQAVTVARAAMPYPEEGTTAASSIKAGYEPAVALGAGYKLLLLQALPYPEAKTSAKASQVLLRVEHVGGR